MNDEEVLDEPEIHGRWIHQSQHFEAFHQLLEPIHVKTMFSSIKNYTKNCYKWNVSLSFQLRIFFLDIPFQKALCPTAQCPGTE